MRRPVASSLNCITPLMVISPAALQDALHWRYATKVFDPGRSIPAETWTALEQSLVLSPSSYGLQPWKFVLIRNPELRQQLRPHSWDQSQITTAANWWCLPAGATSSRPIWIG